MYLIKYFLLLVSSLSFAQITTINGKNITQTEFDSKIKHAMDSLGVTGMSIAVINEGKIVYNKGFGLANITSNKNVTESTFFEAASLSKPVFCLFVLKLAREGIIDIDKPLYEYLPADNIRDERYKKITARMVLSHTTGLPNWSEEGHMMLESNPGEKFSYSGEAFVYLAKVVAKQLNTSLTNLDIIFQEKVAKKFKLKDFNFILTSKIDNNLASAYQGTNEVRDERNRFIFDPAGGLYANTISYSEFLIQLMNHKSDYIEMFNPVIQLENNSPVREYFGVESWALGLAIVKINNVENYWHGGNNLGYTNSFTINPDKKFGYVYFTNADQCNAMKKIVENILWE